MGCRVWPWRKHAMSRSHRSLVWQTWLVLLPKASSDGSNPSLSCDRARWLPACLPACCCRQWSLSGQAASCDAILENAMPCHIGQHHAMLCQAVLCHAMLAHVMLCRVVPCCAMPLGSRCCSLPAGSCGDAPAATA